MRRQGAKRYLICAAWAVLLGWLLLSWPPHRAPDRPAEKSAGQAASEPAWQVCRALGDVQPTASGTSPILVRVDRMERNAMELSYAIPPPSFMTNAVAEDGVVWERVRLANAPSLGRVGAPVLPVVPVRLIVANGYDVEQVEVVREQPIALPGQHRIEPRSPPIPTLPDAQPRTASPDPAIYLFDESYPAQPYTFLGVQKKRGVSVLIMNLHPLAYHPVSGEMTGYGSLKVKVRTRPVAPEIKALPYRPDPVCALTAGTENPAMLALGGYGTTPLAAGAEPLGNLCSAGVTNRYVIVTSAALSNATTDVTVRTLAAHKQARGISSAIVTIEAIRAGYPGVDDAERLRNFITDAYTIWGTDYVLLGGDVTIIPMRKLWNRCLDEGTTWYEDHIPSDLYFQCLDGAFNFNENEKWGEENIDGPNGGDVDLMAEVYIGRASVENETEMANFVYKTMAHENESANARPLRTALMAAEYLGPYPNNYADDQLEEIVQGSDLWGYSTLGFAAKPYTQIVKLYDRPHAWTANDMIAALNSEAYGIVNHLGHANVNYGLRLTNGNVDALTNTRGFFVYSQGCLSGNFEGDCIGEHFTTSTRSGAYAVVFNSRYGFFYSQNTDGPSQHLHRAFWNRLFRDGIQNLGALNATSHEDNIWALGETEIRWCMYASNLLGDPETPLNCRGAGVVIIIL